MLVHEVAEGRGEGVELPCSDSRGSRSGSEVSGWGEVSFRIQVSANDNPGECLYNIDAAKSFMIVQEGEVLLKFDSSVRSFAYNRHVCCRY